jgi:2-polyprenyl-3-methyl-5-hydroxy-6-metoxy-1,4-benzoquinol methylase
MPFGTAWVGGLGVICLGGLSAFGLWWLRATKLLAKQFSPEQWAELQERLRQLPRYFRFYAHWKLRLDPVYELALAELPTKGELLDLGTGIGLLPVLVALARPSLRIRALEWDRRKAEVARRLLKGLPRASVEEVDARAFPNASTSAITMLDILHYGPPSVARRWLHACAGALEPGGVLLIRELEPSTWAVAPWLERVAVRMRLNRGGAVHPHPSSELAQELTGLGLTVVRYQAGFGLFRANTLTVARRPSSSD